MIGETFGNFEIVGRLGKGGMGEVWLAEQKNVRTRVAIKVLDAEISKDQAQVQRFFNEAVAAGKVHHTGIVKIFDADFRDDGQAYLVMELLEGETLGARIRARGRLPMDQVTDLSRQIAGVLEATHAAGVIHRDLKPDNIFIIADSELPSGERVKVLDFGLAKLSDRVGQTTSVSAMGTPNYMSPEQWRNPSKADARSDVYSLGCVMFEMACGKPPFSAATVGEACTKHLSQPPPVPHSLAPDVPVAFDDLVLRLLKKKPASRPTIQDLCASLDVLRGAPTRSDPRLRAARSSPSIPLPVESAPADPHATTMPSGDAIAPPPRRRPVVAIAVVGVAVVAVIALVLWRRSGDDRVEAAAPPSAPPSAPEKPPAPAQALLVSANKLQRTRGSLPQISTAVPITLCIDDRGSVTSVQVVEGAADRVVEEVQRSVLAWKYTPYELGGVPTPVCTMLMISATKAEPRTPPPVVAVEPRTVPPPPVPVDAAPEVTPIDAAAPAPPVVLAPDLPEAPDQAALVAGMAPVRKRIQSCGDFHAASGKVRAKFTIDPGGTVSAIVVDHPNRALATCIADAIASARFPKTRKGSPVDYPFTFR